MISIFHLCKTSRAAPIIISLLTEWVPGIQQLGREADGINNEWIYTSAPPIAVMGCIRTILPFTFIVYYRPTKKQLMVFMEKKAVYSENRMGHEYRCFKC